MAATLRAAQPLYRPAKRITFKQASARSNWGAQLNAAKQDLIIHVSQAYFDVLSAQDTLAFVRAQKAAVTEQLAFAKRNFEVGTSTIKRLARVQAGVRLTGRPQRRAPAALAAPLTLACPSRPAPKRG